jgi:single-strand DNA-binding protein
MRDIATATLSGNLTRDVELRNLPSGTDVARLRVATTTRRRSGEEWIEKTNYFIVEVYGAQARSCAQYLRKGSRVFVDAELDWREWTDQQDNKREAVTFKARQVLFEGGRPAPAAAADGSEQQNGVGLEAAAPAGGEPVGVSTSERDGRRPPTISRSDPRPRLITQQRRRPPGRRRTRPLTADRRRSRTEGPGGTAEPARAVGRAGSRAADPFPLRTRPTSSEPASGVRSI